MTAKPKSWDDLARGSLTSPSDIEERIRRTSLSVVRAARQG